MIEALLSVDAAVDEFDTRSGHNDDVLQTAHNDRIGKEHFNIARIGIDGTPDDVAINVLLKTGCRRLEAR